MALSQLLVEQNFPAIAIHKAMTQDERSVTYCDACHDFACESATVLIRCAFSCFVTEYF